MQQGKKKYNPNPARGERGDFLKTTLHLPADMMEGLKVLSVRRRAAGIKDSTSSALIREAVAELLEREGV
jgi:hypothetical protein